MASAVFGEEDSASSSCGAEIVAPVDFVNALLLRVRLCNGVASLLTSPGVYKAALPRNCLMSSATIASRP